MIGIRADANQEIATGHIMRCMTIADEIKKQGEEVVFFVADDEPLSILRERGFEARVLNSNWKKPADEIDMLAEQVKDLHITTVLFDSYSFDAAYFEAFSKKAPEVRTAYMDDLGQETYPVDVLINYNPYYELFEYDRKYTEKTLCLTGLMYAPLRPQFADMPIRFLQNFPLKILVASGGSDNSGIIPALIREISNRRSLNDYDFHIIMGQFTQSREEIDRIIWCSHNIFKYDHVTEMAKLMSECDIAISASGTMLSELCAVHVPTINYILADNQIYNAQYYNKNGIMLSGGDVREDVDKAAAAILDVLEELAEDKQMRRELGNRMSGLCDGKGAERIANILCNKEI